MDDDQISNPNSTPGTKITTTSSNKNGQEQNPTRKPKIIKPQITRKRKQFSSSEDVPENEEMRDDEELGVIGVEVRKPEQLDSVDSLIIPGGESTTMAKLAEYHNLFPALREFVRLGKPVSGTCAGLIFLANKAYGQKDGGQELVGGLDCTVHRNFFGSQLQSFETKLVVPEIASKEGGPEIFRGVFIRAPGVLEVGPEVEVLADHPVPSVSLKAAVGYCNVLATCRSGSAATRKVIIAVKNILGTTFHPELTADTRWHSYFLKMASQLEEGSSTAITTFTAT
ncbi:unnamed protein product [Rhodiola kirilowii]